MIIYKELQVDTFLIQSPHYLSSPQLPMTSKALWTTREVALHCSGTFNKYKLYGQNPGTAATESYEIVSHTSYQSSQNERGKDLNRKVIKIFS